MAWGQPDPKQQKQAPQDERGDRTRFAVPPACPRCELTKSQMNRTIQNYQKAYRKKVEGLKQELATTRADAAHLRGQVRRLRRKRLLQPPSLLVGAALGAALGRFVGQWWQRRQEKQQQQEAAAGAEDAQQPQQQAPAAAPGTPNGIAAQS